MLLGSPKGLFGSEFSSVARPLPLASLRKAMIGCQLMCLVAVEGNDWKGCPLVGTCRSAGIKAAGEAC